MIIQLKTTKVYEMPCVAGFEHTRHYLVYCEKNEFLQVLQVKENALISILPREISCSNFYLRNSASPVLDERKNKIQALAQAEWDGNPAYFNQKKTPPSCELGGVRQGFFFSK